MNCLLVHLYGWNMACPLPRHHRRAEHQPISSRGDMHHMACHMACPPLPPPPPPGLSRPPVPFLPLMQDCIGVRSSYDRHTRGTRPWAAAEAGFDNGGYSAEGSSAMAPSTSAAGTTSSVTIAIMTVTSSIFPPCTPRQQSPQHQVCRTVCLWVACMGEYGGG
jgi:hypothetical protein